ATFPRRPIAAMQTTAISATRRAYSTIVAPSSPWRRRWVMDGFRSARGADRVSDRAELGVGVTADERDRGDADHGDQCDHQGVLDHGCPVFTAQALALGFHVRNHLVVFS